MEASCLVSQVAIILILYDYTLSFVTHWVLVINFSGIEALFADLSHFPVSAVQIAFTVIVFPCLLLAYSGQAAYLRKYPHHVEDAFYRSIPSLYYIISFISNGYLWRVS